MEGQVSNKKLDEKQTANMVRSAARPTYERKQRIMKSVSIFLLFTSANLFDMLLQYCSLDLGGILVILRFY